MTIKTNGNGTGKKALTLAQQQAEGDAGNSTSMAAALAAAGVTQVISVEGNQISAKPVLAENGKGSGDEFIQPGGAEQELTEAEQALVKKFTEGLEATLVTEMERVVDITTKISFAVMQNNEITFADFVKTLEDKPNDLKKAEITFDKIKNQVLGMVLVTTKQENKEVKKAVEEVKAAKTVSTPVKNVWAKVGINEVFASFTESVSDFNKALKAEKATAVATA